jgi:cellulose synthase/poly-beta-1,6-N-acetylglucosamine synthase-like glycosyltransferase
VANYRKALTEYARGEWVLVLDGDDHLVNPDFIRQAWEALQRHAESSPVFAQGGHWVYDLRGNRPPVDILPNIDETEKLMKGTCYLRFVYETGSSLRFAAPGSHGSLWRFGICQTFLGRTKGFLSSLRFSARHVRSRGVARVAPQIRTSSHKWERYETV